MERIDIATHRPHPPGYVGYVMAARGLDAFLRDPNAALVCWNIIAASLIALLVLRIAWDLAPQQPRPVLFVAAATSLVLTSPLLWFYSEVAEISPAELLGTLALGFCAWRTAQGDRRGLFHLAVAIPLVAFFKLTAALYAHARGPGMARRLAPRPRSRRRAAGRVRRTGRGSCLGDRARPDRHHLESVRYLDLVIAGSRGG